MAHPDIASHDFSKASDIRLCLAAVMPSLEARSRRLTRSRADAQDLVQETVLRALRFEATFQKGTNLRAWMHQIMESVFITRCRSRVRERRALERFVSDPTLSAHAAPSPSLRCVSDSMHAALAALPEKFLSVVRLVDLDDLSYREAAERLAVPVGTVMSRLFRARRMLGAAMAEPAVGTAVTQPHVAEAAAPANPARAAKAARPAKRAVHVQPRTLQAA